MQIELQADIIIEDGENHRMSPLSILHSFVLQIKSINHGWNPKISQSYFNIPYINAIAFLQRNKQIPKFINALPLHGKNEFIIIDDITKDIELEQEKFADLFTNNARMNALKNRNHYFVKFYEDNLKNEHNDFIIQDDKFTKALVSGYLFSKILEYVDKNIIKVLKDAIRNLEYLNQQDNANLIKFYQLTLILFEQKKYQKYYANLTVSKAINLTENESFNYAKNTVYSAATSIRKNVYLNKLNNFQLLLIDDFLQLL